MTHRYSKMNPNDALYIAARNYPGGVDALAARMGMSVKVLYNKLCPNTDSHHVNYHEVQMIIDFLSEVGRHDMVDMVINSFCWRYDLAVFKLPSVEPTDERLLDQMLGIMSKHGVMADGLKDALADGKISSRELDRIEEDFQTCIVALIRLRKTLHAHDDE